jgi:hypothetical protein
LALPALEDKLVLRATVGVLNAIYEQDFLGFTHCCGTTRKGKFLVLRLTSAKRLRAKLQAGKLELRRRMHRPIKEQGQYLRAVVAGMACTSARRVTALD